MICYLDPNYVVEHVTDRIQVLYYHKIVAHVEFTDQACIRDIWVEPKFRQRGIGRHLIQLVERTTGVIPTPMPPVSKLGQKLFHKR